MFPARQGRNPAPRTRPEQLHPGFRAPRCPDGFPAESARPPEEWREEFSLEDAINNPPPGQDEMLAREGHKPRKPA